MELCCQKESHWQKQNGTKVKIGAQDSFGLARFVEAFGCITLEAIPNFIAHTTEDCQLRILITISFSRIIERPMESIDLTGKDRTGGVSVAADSDNGLDVLTDKLVEMLGSVMADVDSDFLHHPHGQRVHMARRIAAGTLHIKLITGEGAQDAFGHVAATTVPGAENQHDGFGSRHVQESVDHADLSIQPLWKLGVDIPMPSDL
jgi:hypothetical protein|tara:strand:- start:30 stop:641 length:612 start_codon:yes stop_codon:yes gene_type:complete